jgi:nucleotide-binding universal stress UspA family protein
MRYSSIVVGTDGSDSATESVRQAASLAASSGAQLHVVSGYGAAAGAGKDGARAVLEAAASEIARSGTGARVWLHAVEADAVRALCFIAKREGAGLIVVGNRGIDHPLRHQQKPICDLVQEHAACSVLVVDIEPYWREVEPSAATPAAAPGRVGREWKVLAISTLAVFMALLDVTIVNVAFPSIRRTFAGTSLSDLSWILNGYNVVVAALLVPAGRLADRIGRRRMFFAGLGIFLGGSAICAPPRPPGF